MGDVRRSFVAAVGIGVLAAAALAWAQEAPKPEGFPVPVTGVWGTEPSRLSDEEIKERLELAQQNTAPAGTTFEQLVEHHLTPRPYPKDSIEILDENYAYPHSAIRFKFEIVKTEGDTVWLRGLPPENPESMLHQLWRKQQGYEMLQAGVRDALKEAYFLDFAERIRTPLSVDTVSWVDQSASLPQGGLWQMSMGVADMNGDGRLDFIMPPARKSFGAPVVILSKADGTFGPWTAVRWDQKVPYDYGAVTVEDFDGDGHLDIAYAIHFRGQYVLYGDGKGDFTRSQRLPSPDPRMTSRAVAAADFDQDGHVDLAFLAEVDVDLATAKKYESGTLWIVRNLGDGGWEVVTEGIPSGVIGDNLRAVDFDGDGRVDLVPSSNSNGWRELVLRNTADGWESVGARWVLSNAYHFDVTPLTLADGRPAVAAAFAQFRSYQGTNEARTGVIVYEMTDEGLRSMTGPVLFDDQRANPYFRIAAGDVNGDGRDDLVASRKEGGLQVLLQGEDGSFQLDREAPLTETARAYDLRILDLDADGRADLVGMFAEIGRRPGGVRAWLSRPQG